MEDLLARHSPNIKWGHCMAILCNACHGRVRRGVGGFWTYSGETNTMPLQVEILYNEYNFTAASRWLRY